jgi:hypothetical protein
MRYLGTTPRGLFAILLAAAVWVLLSVGPANASSIGRSDTKPAGAAKQPAMVMPWIEDDYGRAISEAKARKVPIFVESWAPW